MQSTIRDRSSAPYERREVVLGELRRAHDAHERPGQLEPPAQRASPERHHEVLEVVDGVADPPHHEVRVRPESHGRVDASNRHPLRPFLEQDLGLVPDLVEVAGGSFAKVGGPPEHGIVRVGQLVHEIASCSRPSGGLSPIARSVAPDSRYATTPRAASRPSRTQSAIPTPRNAEPVTNTPGLFARAASIRPTRSRWPTWYWGIERFHRATREATGGEPIPTAASTSSATLAASSSSGRSSAASSPARPTNERRTALSPKASFGHFREIQVQAVMVVSPAGRTKPVPSGICAAVPGGQE